MRLVVFLLVIVPSVLGAQRVPIEFTQSSPSPPVTLTEIGARRGKVEMVLSWPDSVHRRPTVARSSWVVMGYPGITIALEPRDVRRFLAVARTIPDSTGSMEATDSIRRAFHQRPEITTDSSGMAGMLPHYHAVHTPTLHFIWNPLPSRSLRWSRFMWRLASPCAVPTRESGYLDGDLVARADINRQLLAALDSAVGVAEGQPTPAPDDLSSPDQVLCTAQLLAGHAIVRRPPPVSGSSARDAVAYDLRLRFTVDSTGRVERESIEADGPSSSPEPLVVDARRTVELWRFAAARTASGAAARQRVRALVHFPALVATTTDTVADRRMTVAIDSARIEQRDLVAIASRVPAMHRVVRTVRTTGGARLAVDDGGPRATRPIVIVHGTPSAARFHEGLIDALRERYRVVAYDLRGFGRSEPAADGSYSMDAHVRDLPAVIDSLDLTRPIIVGAGEGGLIAIDYAARRPDRVSAVFFVGSPWLDIRFPPETRSAYIEQFEKIARGTDQRLPRLAFYWPWEQLRKEQLIELTRVADRAALRVTLEAMYSYDPGPALNRYRGVVWSVGAHALRASHPLGPPLGVRIIPLESHGSLTPVRLVRDAIGELANYIDRDDAARRRTGCAPAIARVRAATGSNASSALADVVSCGSAGREAVAAAIRRSSRSRDTVWLRQLIAFAGADDRGDVVDALVVVIEDSTASKEARGTALLAIAELRQQAREAVWGRRGLEPTTDTVPRCRVFLLPSPWRRSHVDGHVVNRVSAVVKRILEDPSSDPALREAAECAMRDQSGAPR